MCVYLCFFFFFQAEDGIRDLVRSRGLGDVYKRQGLKEELTMARISGVDIPREKRLEISLTYIFGIGKPTACLLYTSPSPRDRTSSRMPSSA